MILLTIYSNNNNNNKNTNSNNNPVPLLERVVNFSVRKEVNLY